MDVVQVFVRNKVNVLTEKMTNKILIGYLCAIGTEVVFGMSYIFTKQAVNEASTFSLLGWRFFTGFAIMSLCILFGIVKVNFKGKNFKNILAIALFRPVINYLCETLGISHTTASESGVFIATLPVVSFIASALILHRKPTKSQLIGVLVTLSGVVITVLAVDATASFSIAGYAFLLAGVTSYALYSVFVEKETQFSGAEITYIMLSAGALVYTVIALIEAGMKGNIDVLVTLPFKNTAFLTAILYQGIGCSILAFFMSNVAIANIGVNKNASLIGISTVISIIAGVVFMHESFSAYQLIGAIVILAGVYIANISVLRGTAE